jgi:serine/threonine protein kinase
VTPERWAQIRRTFEDALDRPPGDRGGYLGGVCAGDDELRREVESLLQSHHQSESFLSTPAVNLNQALLSSDDGAGEYPPGYRVGPYQLERRIGRGGMGSVWVAARADHEYEKKVAVKLVRRGMDSQEILRRFRTERQLLAGLDHPNIARLIDGGSTPDGLPYLVMEYVEGTPIDRFCESRKISISERLKLFRAVCAAVQYAHQNLVVHRDIKAGNILVTAAGAPKLLDFGIAKLLRTDLSTQEMLAQTRPDLRPMTLDYASPEQVRGDPITTATDVYSLGVLLYKLLTGKTPYGVESSNPSTFRHAILEVEPRRLSAVILSDFTDAIPQATQKLEAVAEPLDKARRRLKKKLSGDLDAIVLKALAKDPLHRYVSAEQFSEDIRRYLDSRPVSARSDTPGYRTARFIRRNVVGTAAAAAVSVALIASAIGAVHYARITAQQRDQVERNLESAQRDLLAAYLQSGANPAKAYEIAKAIYVRDPQQAEAQRDVARAAANLADLVAATDRGKALGLYTEALAIYSRTLEIAEKLYASEPSEENRRAVASGNFHVGYVLAHNGAAQEGLVKLRKAQAIYEELLAAHGGDAATRNSLAAVYRALGGALQSADRSNEAADSYQHARALLPAESAPDH